MNKDEIIELLKEQNSHYKALVDSLLAQVKELTEEVSSLKEAPKNHFFTICYVIN